MTPLLRLSDDRTTAELAPELGGGIAGLTAKRSDGPVPILRPWQGEDSGPFGLASNLLVPFSNRISGGGFAFGGTFHEVPPNLAGEPFPIHGDGFQKPWDVQVASEARAVLRLEDGSIGPWRYRAEATFELKDGVLHQALQVTNRSGTALPFGGGFHPWFPRTGDTSIRFAASGVWLEDERHLPTRHVETGEVPGWNFSAGSALPDGWINNAFTGWPGEAEITQPGDGLTVSIRATDPLNVAILFSPGREAGFFCFEPVSHAVDAHNLEGQPGLVVLEDGRSMTLRMSIGWRSIPD